MPNTQTTQKTQVAAKDAVRFEIGAKKFILFTNEVPGASLYENGAVPDHRVLELNGVLVPKDAAVPIKTGDHFLIVSPIVKVNLHSVIDPVDDAHPVRTIEVPSEGSSSDLYAAAALTETQVMLRENGEVIERMTTVNVSNGESIGIF